MQPQTKQALGRLLSFIPEHILSVNCVNYVVNYVIEIINYTPTFT
jgi:hypothetical protein